MDASHGRFAAERDAVRRAPRFWRSRFGIGWLVLAAVAGWFLWAEHRAHLLGAWPLLLVLACPVMHLFMHRGHHGSHQGSHDASAQPPAPPSAGRPGETA
jgi:hypothetical protein